MAIYSLLENGTGDTLSDSVFRNIVSIINFLHITYRFMEKNICICLCVACPIQEETGTNLLEALLVCDDVYGAILGQGLGSKTTPS